jgi:hypothetical protein
MCIRPPEPDTAAETEPFADRIVHRTVAHNLGTLAAMTNSMTCLNDEVLLGGGCMINSTISSSYQVTLNLSTDDDRNSHAWRCGWDNPTQTTGIPAVTTAVCLRPPEQPPEQALPGSD